MMSDEGHHFESKADAEASKTFPQQASTIRKNGYIVIKNRPCKRAEVLGLAEFPILGRIRNNRVRVKDTTFSSRQYGTRESKEVTIEGRVQFDLLQVVHSLWKGFISS